MKIGIIVSCLTIIGIIYFILKDRKKTPQFTKQIQIEKLESIITQLLDNRLEYNFFGITSNGIDCIYFVNENREINIEFKVITDEQKPYVDKIDRFSKKIITI